MKKLLLLLSFLLAYCISFAQYPITQNLGAPKTLVVSKGGLAADSTLILPYFTDTLAANLSPYVKNYPGNMIFLTALDQIWVRNSTATKWLLLAVSGGAPGTVTSISQGYGMTNTPNPLTTSGTIKVDTTASTGLSGKYLRIIDTNKLVSKTQSILTTSPLTGGGNLSTSRTISIPQSSGSTNGYLSSGDWTTFNNKVATTRTISTTSPLTGGGDLSANRILSISQADQSTNGYLSSSDWTKFNNKIAIISVTSPLTTSSGPNQTVNLDINSASSTQNGYLTSANFNTFSNKVDTIFRTVGKDSIQFYINGRYRAIKDSVGGSGTITRAVDTIYRTLGKDSIIFTINGTRRAIKDSIGGIFTKNIIMNGTSSNRLGNYVNGDTIPVAGLGLDSAFKIIAQRAIPPTYVAPTATISSSPSAGTYEIGTSTAVTLSNTFTQNDAGALSSTTYYKNGSVTSNPSSITLTSQTDFRVQQTYAQGACKNNNLGVQDCTGRIAAGSVYSSYIYFTPLPKRYWGYTSASAPNSSQVIAANGGGSELTSSKDKIGFSVVVTGTNQYVYYAYPSSFGLLTSIVVSGLESIYAFNQTTVAVTNAQGYTQNYYVYTSQNQFNNTTVTFTSVN